MPKIVPEREKLAAASGAKTASAPKKKRKLATTMDEFSDEIREDVAEPVAVKAAKKKTKKEILAEKRDPKNRSFVVSDMLAAAITGEKNHTGARGSIVVAEENELVTGLPLPSLAMEYLLASSVLPLGRLIHLYGQWASCKSTLLYEIFRWHVMCGGLGFLAETEQKISTDMWQNYISVGGSPRGAFCTCKYVEAWQQYVLDKLQFCRKRMDGTVAEPGVGRIIPVALGLDSLAACMSEKTHDQILSDGHATRGFAVEAALNARFLRVFKTELDELPMTFVLVNHLTQRTDTMTQNVVEGTLGGVFSNFAATLELKLRRIGKKQTMADHEQNNIRIQCMKNSFGPDNRVINVGVKYWYAKKRGETSAVPIGSRFDWHTATFDLIEKLLTGAQATQCKKVLELERTVVGRDTLVYSKALGVTKSDAMDIEQLGEVLMQNKPVVAKLRELLQIRVRPVFEPAKYYESSVFKVRSREEAVGIA